MNSRKLTLELEKYSRELFHANGDSAQNGWLTRSLSQPPLVPYGSHAQWRIVNAVKVTRREEGQVSPYGRSTRGSRATIFTPVRPIASPSRSSSRQFRTGKYGIFPNKVMWRACFRFKPIEKSLHKSKILLIIFHAMEVEILSL